MIERYGRWIAALLVLALFLSVVILFGTVDLNPDEHTLSDVHSAPILSTDIPTELSVPPLPSQDSSPPGEKTPRATDDSSP